MLTIHIIYFISYIIYIYMFVFKFKQN